ncbi:MAG: MFS transporter [Rhizobiaceae bacterium]|nr:MFS transporter [Rhizobiaceae bacterium]
MSAQPIPGQPIAGQPTPGEHQPRVGLVIGAVAATLLLASLGQTIVSTALPTIVSDLGGLDHLSWVVIAYLLASTVVAPVYGKLGDLYGRKVVLQVAILIFLIGAALSAFASSMTFLIAARALQGLGGGGLMVVAMTVVADVIPPRQRGKVQGVFGGVFGVSTVIGPLLGGFIVEHFSWHWIFLVNLPVGIAALAVIAAALPARAERIEHSIDYAGFALLTGSLSAIVLFTSLGGNTFAWTDPMMIGLAVAAPVLLALFVWVESRAKEPVLPLKLFRNNTFVVTNAVGFIVGLAMFGSITFLPLYLQIAKGVSPTESGLQLLPMMIGLIGASTLSGTIMSRTGHYRWLPIASTALLVVGLLLLGTMQIATPDWQVGIYMFLVGLGIGPTMSVGVTASQNAVERSMVGVATAGTTMFRQIGGSIGISVFGAIFSNRLAAELGGLGGGHAGGSGAFNRDMIAALPEPVRETVLNAFASALHPVFFVAAAAGVIAFAVSFLLKEIPLSNVVRKEPEAEIAAEEAGAAAVAAAPAYPSR